MQCLGPKLLNGLAFEKKKMIVEILDNKEREQQQI